MEKSRVNKVKRSPIVKEIIQDEQWFHFVTHSKVASLGHAVEAIVSVKSRMSLVQMLDFKTSSTQFISLSC
ncbi:hypothetical protein P5673_001604, partial [Acropora cervicornis]